MPREIRAVAPDELEIVEYDAPEPGEGQVVVRSEFGAAKHGTEMAFFKGYGGSRGRYDGELGLFVEAEQEGWHPVSPGNMFVGPVLATGPGVSAFAEGDCVLGYGPFREVHVVGTGRLWKMPEGMSWKSAVCLDPADFAMAAVRDGEVRVGDAVAVFGMGAIGLMCVQIAALAGAYPVIAVEPLPNRREVAAACGADVVLDPGDCDAGKEIKLATDRRGVDVAIEYSGNVHALQAALRGVAYGGNVVAGAFPGPYPEGLDLGAEAHMNIPNIKFSRACSEPNRDYPRWNEDRIYDTCWRLLCEGRLSGEEIVTPVVEFEELPEAYLDIAKAPEKNVKLGARF